MLPPLLHVQMLVHLDSDTSIMFTLFELICLRCAIITLHIAHESNLLSKLDGSVFFEISSQSILTGTTESLTIEASTTSSQEKWNANTF